MLKNSEFEQKLSILCTYKKDFDFSSISTIKIGPKCKYYAIVHSTSCLIKVLKLCKQFEINFFVVGNASNILFCGEYFSGVVIRIGMNKISFSNNVLTAFAGAKLPEVLQQCLKRKLSGLECLAGIPASVGGAVVMNAGAFGGQIADVLNCVYALNINTLKVKKFSVLEYLPKHHESVFTNNHNYVIIKAEFCLTQKSKSFIKQSMLGFIQKRSTTQNVGLPNLGSVFKRGDYPFAPAYYIEQCGLKEVCVGGAMVSKKHSGFIVNTGLSKARDVVLLIKKIQDEVFSKFGVQLEPEIIIVGEENEYK